MQRRGRYKDVLDEFVEAFGTLDMMQLLPFEWIREDAEALLSQVFSHLGCMPYMEKDVMRQVFSGTSKTDAMSDDDRRHVVDAYSVQTAQLAPSLWWQPLWATSS